MDAGRNQDRRADQEIALRVAALMHHLSRYKIVARAMVEGIRACGDEAIAVPIDAAPPGFDCAVCYGWKRRDVLKRYRQFVYADLSYWKRETHYRLSVGGWSPHRYVRAGLSADRLESFGVEVKPWQDGGDEVLIFGAQAKAMHEHGIKYLEWETDMARELLARGVKVVYRPKPTDPMRAPLQLLGVGYDDGPLDDALKRARCVVTHHSNAALDALVAGVSVYCETGAAAAFSVARDEIADPPRRDGREQFLADCAWLQWSVDEMRGGSAWAHLKERGLIRC